MARHFATLCFTDIDMSQQQLPDEPAFPVPDSHYANGEIQFGSSGMTLRDYFAGQALAGMMASGDIFAPDSAASCAYVLADSMLKERRR